MQRMLAHCPPGVWAARWHDAAQMFATAQRQHLDYRQALLLWIHKLGE